MQHSPTLHRVWCDRRHVEVGSPVCSTVVGRVEVITVMLYANGEDGTDVAITGADGASLLAWPPHMMLQLVRRLDEATQIALGTWPPLLDDAGHDPARMTMYERWAADEAWWAEHSSLVDEAERQLRTFLVGQDVDRATAARYLISWERYGELSATEVSELLGRFGPMPQRRRDRRRRGDRRPRAGCLTAGPRPRPGGRGGHRPPAV
jgi:hypothetical protein